MLLGFGFGSTATPGFGATTTAGLTGFGFGSVAATSATPSFGINFVVLVLFQSLMAIIRELKDDHSSLGKLQMDFCLEL